MVAGFITLEYLIHPFKQEGPELNQRAIITNALWYVNSVVVVRTNDRWPIQLMMMVRKDTWDISTRVAYLDQFQTIFTYQTICFFNLALSNFA